MTDDLQRSPNVERIETDIATTRQRMGDTLEELGARLNPDRLKREAVATVRAATIGRVETAARKTATRAATTGRKATSLIRKNPLPVGLTAVGIGWLVWRWSTGRDGTRSQGSALIRRHLKRH